jgi:thiol-disulfide isomerase/thioredoxin
MIGLLVSLSACDTPPVATHIPEFTLTSLDGTKTPIQTFSGKLLVLNVWATWCPPCRREMPSLERLSKNADSKRIVVAAIATDASVHAVQEFLTLHKITFPIYTDTPGNVANNLGVRVYPETLLIAPDGKIVQRIAGERDWDSPEMLKVLEAAYLSRQSDSDIIPVVPAPSGK